jgi:hypothetical protein
VHVTCVLGQVSECPPRTARHVGRDVLCAGYDIGERRDLLLGALAEPLVIKHHVRLQRAAGGECRAAGAEPARTAGQP